MIAPTPSLLSSGLAGLQRFARKADRAALSIARSGLEPAAAAAGPASDPAAPAACAPDDVTGAMVDLLVAQRMFAAQLRVVRTADEMMQTAVELPRSPAR